MLDQQSIDSKTPGIPQGLVVILAGFLPILAIVSMFPAVGAIIAHFAPTDPSAATKVPAMVTAPGLAVAVVALFAGVLVDKYGRRRLLLVSTFSYGIIGVIPFFLENLDAIYVSRLFLGLSEAMILTTINTLIADYWDDSGRRRWLTLQGMVGPALASVMIFFAGTLTAWRWNGIFLLYLLALPIGVAMLRYMFEPKSDDTVRKVLGITGERVEGFPWKNVAGIAALTLFCSFIYYVFIVNGSLVWQEIGIDNPKSIGQISALPSLFILAGAGLFWWMHKKGIATRWLVTTFLGLLGGGLAIMGLAQNWQSMIVGMAMQQSGAGMAIPVLISWAQSRLPFQHRGRGMGVWTSTFFFGQFSSPLIVSLLRSSLGTMQAAFVACGVLSAIVAVVVIVTMRDDDAKAAQPAVA